MRVRQIYRDVFDLVPGGIERHVRDLAAALSTSVDVEVVGAARRPWPSTWHDGRVAVRAAAELGRVGGVPLAPGIVLRAAAPWVDIVHHHGPNPVGEVALAVPLRRKPNVMTWHCDPHRWRRAQPAYLAAVATALRRCERVLVSSERLLATSDLLTRFVERRPDAVRIVPFGVDVERFTPELDGARTDELAGGSTSRRPVVLFVGRLRPYKGLDVLVRALRDVDATLRVVGDGPEREQLASFGREVLGERLQLTGPVPDAALPDLYRSADLLCLPSTSAAEAFGIVLLEAMACGLPVVSTEVGTATSVVNRDGVTGLVVPPSDPATLATAVESILGDRTRSATMGRAAREHVLRHHDVRKMAGNVLGVYREVLE